ncbi:Glutamyl-tRNA synthetase [Chytriomyces hyalinus]|nr:Glutamyl-tRNA synthetase [Chytriomyces hyalinus]
MITRFAPSPTGLLHLGGLRTALFNYALSRSSGDSQQPNRFLLRIEDTDSKRRVPGAAEAMQATLKAMGLQWDEGPGADPRGLGPFVQSQRSELYKEHADSILEKGAAYRCFCTQEQLLQSRSGSTAKNAGYDRRCRHLSQSQISSNLARNVPYSIRLKVAEGTTEFTDLIHGKLEFNNRTLDDSILFKSDGLPTYHLANVVDDAKMGVTHVMRGEEWIPSTPKHVLIYRAFGWDLPQFIHLPLLVNSDGAKLSKRHHDVNVDSLVQKGYLPEAILNFVGMLGFSPPSAASKDIWFLSDFVKEFSIDALSKSSAIVSYDHLDRLNKLHISHRLSHNSPERADILKQTRHHILEYASSVTPSMVSQTAIEELQNDADSSHLLQILQSVQGRATFVKDFYYLSRPFFFLADYSSEAAIQFKASLPPTLDLNYNSQQILAILSQINPNNEKWVPELKSSLKQLAKRDQQVGGYAGLMKSLRYVLTGEKVGDDLLEFVALIRIPEAVRRLEAYLGA